MNNQSSNGKMNKTKINLLLDIGLLVALYLVYEVKATGVPIHEWLGVGFAAVILVHILLHWNWIVNFTKKFFHTIKTEPRINYIVNLGIFIGFTTIMFTGLMISQSVLSLFGLEGSHSFFWKWLHFKSADVTFILTALHIALHWRWVVSTVKKYMISPIAGRFSKNTPIPSTESV